MDLFRKLTLSGIGLVFVLGLSATEASAQRYGRNSGNVSFSVRVGQYQPRYYRSYDRSRAYGRYGYRNSAYRYGSDYGRNRYGLSWRERRILAIRRAKAIRAVNRYQRTRERMLDRSSYRNSYNYRNW